MAHEELLHQLLAAEGFVLVREHPKFACTLRRMVRRDRLIRILPGVLVDPGRADDLATRAHAVTRWDPQAVITGRAAAALTYWSELSVDTIEVSSPREHGRQTGYTFTQRRVPADLRMDVGGVAVTTPSMTAVEVATLDFPDPIDRALRESRATLGSLTDALRRTPRRRGNTARWQLLLDSRAEPWSEAERIAHKIYRRAGITGWVANLRVQVPDFGVYYLDVAFERERLACEIDGLIHQTDRDLFESDRSRQNALVIDGWWVVRFTYRMLTDDPGYVVSATQHARSVAARKSGLVMPNWRNTRAISS